MARWFDVITLANGRPAAGTAWRRSMPASQNAAAAQPRLGVLLLGHIARPGGLLFPMVEHVSEQHPILSIDLQGSLPTLHDQRILELERLRKRLAAKFGFGRVLVLAENETATLAFRFAMRCPRGVAWTVALTPSDLALPTIVTGALLRGQPLNPKVDVLYAAHDSGGQRVADGLRQVLPDTWHGLHCIAGPDQEIQDLMVAHGRTLVQQRLASCQAQFAARPPQRSRASTAPSAHNAPITAPGTRAHAAPAAITVPPLARTSTITSTTRVHRVNDREPVSTHNTPQTETQERGKHDTLVAGGVLPAGLLRVGTGLCSPRENESRATDA